MAAYVKLGVSLVDELIAERRAEAATALEATGVEIVAFDADQAIASGDLRRTTRAHRLSLGDRAGLALAAARGVAAVTADTAWAGVDGVEVRLIR